MAINQVSVRAGIPSSKYEIRSQGMNIKESLQVACFRS